MPPMHLQRRIHITSPLSSGIKSCLERASSALPIFTVEGERLILFFRHPKSQSSLFLRWKYSHHSHSHSHPYSRLQTQTHNSPVKGPIFLISFHLSVHGHILISSTTRGIHRRSVESDHRKKRETQEKFFLNLFLPSSQMNRTTKVKNSITC